MNPKLESLKGNEEEIKKCQESPLYFYNTYMLKEGQRPMTQQEYDLLVKQMEGYRNGIPLRMRRGNIVFMKPIKEGVLPEYFDSGKTNHLLLDEAGQWATPEPNVDYQKAIKNAKSRRNHSLNSAGEMMKELIFAKPKPEYNMGVDFHNGNAAFVVMKKDGEVMEYGNGKDDATFRAEVERAAKFYNIQPVEILKETD